MKRVIGNFVSIPFILNETSRIGRVLEEFPGAGILLVKCEATGEVVICEKNKCREIPADE